MEPNKVKLWLITPVIFIGLIIAGGCSLSQKSTVKTQDEQESSKEEVKTPKKDESPSKIKLGYDIESLENKTGGYKLISVEDGTAVIINEEAISEFRKNQEDVTSFYAPIDPKDSSIVYLSTTSAPNGEFPNQTVITKIYSYNIKTGKLTNIYQEEKSHLLRTVGIEDEKLIIMNDLIDNSPGPCFSIWLWEDFSYLDVTNPNNGLKIYKLPQSQIEAGKAEEQKCINENL